MTLVPIRQLNNNDDGTGIAVVLAPTLRSWNFARIVIDSLQQKNTKMTMITKQELVIVVLWW
jgi:hypothetical protein